MDLKERRKIQLLIEVSKDQISSAGAVAEASDDN
jgi:hypothetical protein